MVMSGCSLSMRISTGFWKLPKRARRSDFGVGGLGAARSSDGTNSSGSTSRSRGMSRCTWSTRHHPASRRSAPHDLLRGAREPGLCRPPRSGGQRASSQCYTAISDDLVTWTQEGLWTLDRGADPAVWCAEPAGAGCPGGGAASTDGGRTYSPVEMNLPDPPPTAPDVFAVLADGG